MLICIFYLLYYLLQINISYHLTFFLLSMIHSIYLLISRLYTDWLTDWLTDFSLIHWLVTADRAFPEYAAVIKHPVDLTSIKKKISNKEFGSISEALSELRLVWDNCCLFNSEGSDIHAAALSLAEFTEGLVLVSLYAHNHCSSNPVIHIHTDYLTATDTDWLLIDTHIHM